MKAKVLCLCGLLLLPPNSNHLPSQCVVSIYKEQYNYVIPVVGDTVRYWQAYGIVQKDGGIPLS